ncbi:MAG TPA: aminoacyl-tRNA hydrolase [Ignavibacteria bacterium]|nr:aminoacyl-tRNA hydrolase [Ignavibacteria bacterium]HRK00309.1 aminoacyl-tRNA hydrolase [Ignavibacteria bacterium]
MIVGLGNPGVKYENTRHNIGFLILDQFAANRKKNFKAGKGDWYECGLKVNGEDVILMKPVTYMNNSGSAVKEFCELHDLKNEDVLVIYDDFQLRLGMIRVRKKGSDGGHNGISDIMYMMNTEEIPRMRAGIGNEEILSKDEFIDFVLSDFSKDEFVILKKLMPEYEKCIISFITEDIKVTMNNFNRSFLISGKENSEIK